jgi:hypothetical protein
VDNRNLKFITDEVFPHLLNEGKIKIPEWANKVKIDVGTSINAPNSEIWLNNDSELCVFAFEPNIFNIKHLHSGKQIWPTHLNPNKINYSFFYTQCALSNFISESEDFFCTDIDGGTSSLFLPIDTKIQVKEITKIPVITLELFFEFFPWEKIPYIEQIKIDAQSSDFNIIKGIGKYLSERIVYLDVETTTNNQYSNNETPIELKRYLESNGFECLNWGINATFFNKKFINIKHNINYSIIGD